LNPLYRTILFFIGIYRTILLRGRATRTPYKHVIEVVRTITLYT